MATWLEALKKWNAGKKWSVPKKGTAEHAEVKKLMGKKEKAVKADKEPADMMKEHKEKHAKEHGKTKTAMKLHSIKVKAEAGDKKKPSKSGTKVAGPITKKPLSVASVDRATAEPEVKVIKRSRKISEPIEPTVFLAQKTKRLLE